MIPEGLYFTKEHEWVRIHDDTATIGITDHAVDELGEIVFVELPKVGENQVRLSEFGTVESVKTVSSLYCPMTGQVSEVNELVKSAPEKINSDPYNDGWLIRIKITDPGEAATLLSASDYQEHLKTL